MKPMRPISQQEAERMRETLKEIAEFKNDGLDPKEPGQAAAIKARATLEDLELFFQADAMGSPETAPKDPAD